MAVDCSEKLELTAPLGVFKNAVELTAHAHEGGVWRPLLFSALLGWA
jgi:hypothetical protein